MSDPSKRNLNSATRFKGLYIMQRIVGALADLGQDPTIVPVTIQLAPSQTADALQVLDTNGDLLFNVSAAGIAGPAPQSPTPFGLGGAFYTARAEYNFAVDGGAIGLITPAVNATIPNNAIILGALINPTTAFVGATATISFGTAAGSSAASIKAATAVASFTLDALLPGIPVFTAGSAFKMTAPGAITLTVAVAPLTAGVAEITLFYFVAAN
jgi:hypothetical protein